MKDLTQWTPRALPPRQTLQGQRIRLEPLTTDHSDSLYDTCTGPGGPERFNWLFEHPPTDRDTFRASVHIASTSQDPLFFAVIDQATGTVLGRQTLMRIDPAYGAIEIGNIYWGPTMARRPAATEALYLMAAFVFDDLGYRRFEWKCNNDNGPSKSAALRFGFQAEGVFRQHMIQKGKNRDTAWFAMLDADWPALKSRYLRWLAPTNFDAQGQQIHRLQDI